VPVTPAQPVRASAGSEGRFDMQLYDINATIAMIDGRQVQFSVRQVGWLATSPALSGDGF